MSFMESSEERLSPVRAVVARTGVSAHLLRAWERRYGAVEPRRSSGGQRQYTEGDVERIRLLRDAVAEGHPISSVANLGIENLRELARPVGEPTTPSHDGSMATGPLRREAFDAIERRDADALRPILHRAALLLPHLAFLEDFLARLLRDMGAAWERGTLGVAEEHLATRVVRDAVGEMLAASNPLGPSPLVLCTTPPGQRHEFGALLASLTASHAGWRSMYLGPDLPIEEIVRLARADSVRAVALSILHPDSEQRGGRTLHRLRTLLPPAVSLYVGGHPEALAMAEGVEGVESFESFSEFERALRALVEASGRSP